MDKQLMAEQLIELQVTKNEGRGVESVRTVCTFLFRNDWDSARRAVIWDYDKIRSYPDIDEYLRKVGLYEPSSDWGVPPKLTEEQTSIVTELVNKLVVEN